MMPILGIPLALLGLTALPALTAIYWLRTRFRRQEVSSLFLWSLVAKAYGGGRRATRLQTPLLWLLELLALLMLALAAAGPRIPRADHVIPVMVVLDDSLSMTAIHKDGQSSRLAGIDAIKEELGALGPFTARFVVAGPQPVVVEESVSRLTDIDRAIEGWHCESVSSSIDLAVSLAREIAGPSSRVLVVTDQARETDEESGNENKPADRLRWRAVGTPIRNVGIVNAVRSTDPQRDEILLEVANFNDHPSSVTLMLSVGSGSDVDLDDENADALGSTRPIDRRTLDLAAGETRQLRLATNSPDAVLVAEIENDAMLADNRAVLMPPGRDQLPVSVTIEDSTLSKAVRSAVEATGMARITSTEPRINFADRTHTTSVVTSDTETVDGDSVISDRPWRVEFAVPPAEEIDAFLGPFVIDYTHPVTSGLSLTGLVWAAPGGDQVTPPLGRPIISAGDIQLIGERSLSGRAKALQIRLRADRSTLLTSAAWPVLIANTIDWRRAELPGLSHINARPGLPVTLNLASPADRIVLTRFALDGSPTQDPSADITARDNTVIMSADRPGIYLVKTADQSYRYVVNSMSAEESDLRKASRSEQGLWNDEQALRTDYRGLGWILGLAALVLLATHAWLLYHPRGQAITSYTEGTA